VRSYGEETRQQTLAAIRRIVRGQAISAGIPEDRLPEVKLSDDFTAATYNDPELTTRIATALKSWLGNDQVIKKKPTMGGEDFGEYGRTTKIPICMFHVGGVRPEQFKESQQSNKPLPSLHSPLWAPLPEPTIKTGVTAMSAAVLELMGKK